MFDLTGVYYFCMPRRNLDKYFEEERPEWTRRKHAILGRIVVPSASKLKRVGRGVALIDGYSGPNMYGGEIAGSTLIMCKAAAKAIREGGKAAVYACEEDTKRFESMCANLNEYISDGVLKPINSSHAEAIHAILPQITGMGAVVFLDPQTCVQMSVAKDIAPWAARTYTDILGVFMASQAVRVCASPDGHKYSQQIFGPEHIRVQTLEVAYEVFENSIRPLKKFAGLYRLRKQGSGTEAYGFFGLSDKGDGYWLLSEAVAKDFGQLKGFDAADATPSMFAEDDRQAQFSELVELVRRGVPNMNSTDDGQAIAVAMLEAGGRNRRNLWPIHSARLYTSQKSHSGFTATEEEGCQSKLISNGPTGPGIR